MAAPSIWMDEAHRVEGKDRKVDEFRRRQCHVTLIMMKPCGDERRGRRC